MYSIQQQQQHCEQQQQQHTNQQHHYHQQLPQTRNKRLEKLKKLKLREIQSLALEGGDTGRGYCSCDEQWNGSTSSASSPTSVSPIEQQQPQQPQQQQEEPLAQEEPQGQLKLQTSIEDTILTAATTKTSPTPSTRTIIMTTALSAAVTSTTMPNNNIEAQEKTSENGSDTNDAAGGSGYNRTNKQCNGSVAMTITTSLLKQQQQQQQHEHQHNEHDKLNRMGLKKLNETNNFPDTISISPGSSSNIKTITLRRNPIQQRLKQQHHVRFSDEKNFSD